ncbi:hypothetical protein SDC9_90596 [bioreactor metagenome]|uniref:Type I restriction modification DNA specificity domain-containing protein n=1 Tax=bioreactor metagenome TaxID=1076179 RepID=A0A644ZU33_9ZZZZ
MKDIVTKSAEKNKDKKIETVFSNSAIHGIVLQEEYFDRNIVNKDNLVNYYVVRPNDFVYNPRLSNNAEVGAMSVNHTGITGIVSPLYTIFWINNKDVFSMFLEYIFKSKVWHQHMRDVANFGARDDRMNIKSEDFYSLPIHIPSLEEQEKIARFLSLIDERIATQNKIIAHLESLIKGLYSTTSKIGWRNYLLSELMIERKELNTSLFPIYSVSVDVGLVDQIEHLGRSFAAKDTSNYNVVRLGDVVYTKSPTGSFPFGIVKQSLVNVAIAVSPLYGVYQPKSIHIGRIIQHYFASPIRTSNYLHSLIQKGAKNTINISTQHFLDKAILLPSREDEIICLSELLDSYNIKCELEKEIRKHLLFQKIYLLQKLFI